MKNIRTILATALLASLVTSPAVHAADYLSPQDLATLDGRVLYVGEVTGERVVALDTATAKVEKLMSFDGPAGGLTLSPDGALLLACEAAVEGRLFVYDTAKKSVLRKIAVGHTPWASAFDPATRRAYVTCRYNDDIAVVNVDTGTVLARVPAVREPCGAALASGSLFVANLLPAGRANADRVAASVSVIDTASNAVAAVLYLPNGSHSAYGVCASPDGAFVYVVHSLAHFQLPTTQLDRGWMNTAALTVIDAKKRTIVNTVLLDDVDLGAANPRSVAVTADGARLVVTHQGTHEISVIDRLKMHEKIDKANRGERVSAACASADDVPCDLSFLVDLRRRITIPGKGSPRGLALAGDTAFAAEYFGDRVARVELAPGAAQPSAIPLGPAPKITQVRQGEMFFYDGSLCFQQWQSCVSCHPDVRVDALNWDLLNDGMGNPKNTKSMLYSHKTPPAMSMGVRDSAEVAVRAGLRYIQFVQRPEEDAVAIDEFLKTLRPLPGPAQDRKAVARGAKLFKREGCTDCHKGTFYTDLKEYDVDTGTGRDDGKPFDTPTLVEVWRTGPYYHDGRAATLVEALNATIVPPPHGISDKLTAAELADLVAYLKTL